MLGAGGGAQGGDGIGNAELGQGDDVHVTLDHQQAFELTIGLLGLVESVKLTALVKDGGLRRIQVLGLLVAEHAATEADDSAPAVADGEHDAVAKAVVALAVLLDHEPALEQVLTDRGAAAEGAEQEVPAGGGKPEPEAGGYFSGQPPALEIVHGPPGLGVLA